MAPKIGFVSPYDLSVAGGVNSHIAGLMAELRDRGAEVRVIGPASQPPDDADAIPIGGAVPIPVAGSRAHLGVNPVAAFEVRRVLTRERFDVLHLHEPYVPMTCFWSLSLSGAVNVGTFHLARERPHLLYLAASPLLRPLGQRLHGRIAVSPAARRTVSQFLPGNYRIVPNGIDVGRFAGERGTPAHPRIVFVGRMEPRKGLKVLLRAFARLRGSHPEAELVVAGDGPERDDAEAFVRSQGLERVRFLGRVPDDELPAVYRSATVFCSPAVRNESFGIVLVEGMAAGAPAVASAISGHRWVTRNGRDGMLVPPGDDEALAQALAGLIDDPAERERLSALSRARARDFDWPVIADRVVAQYRLAALRAERELPGLAELAGRQPQPEPAR